MPLWRSSTQPERAGPPLIGTAWAAARGASRKIHLSVSTLPKIAEASVLDQDADVDQRRAGPALSAGPNFGTRAETLTYGIARLISLDQPSRSGDGLAAVTTGADRRVLDCDINVLRTMIGMADRFARQAR